jgi:hypothetical protein
MEMALGLTQGTPSRRWPSIVPRLKQTKNDEKKLGVEPPRWREPSAPTTMQIAYPSQGLFPTVPHTLQALPNGWCRSGNHPQTPPLDRILSIQRSQGFPFGVNTFEYVSAANLFLGMGWICYCILVLVRSNFRILHIL